MSQVDEQVRDEAPARMSPDITSGWAIGAAVAWVAGYQTMLALEPAAAQPEAIPGVFATAMGLLMTGGMLTIALGLVTRARWAFVASGATALLLAGQVVACPITGHHQLGAWWAIQAAIAAGLVALSLAGWQAAARSGRAE